MHKYKYFRTLMWKFGTKKNSNEKEKKADEIKP